MYMYVPFLHWQLNNIRIKMRELCTKAERISKIKYEMLGRLQHTKLGLEVSDVTNVHTP